MPIHELFVRDFAEVTLKTRWSVVMSLPSFMADVFFVQMSNWVPGPQQVLKSEQVALELVNTRQYPTTSTQNFHKLTQCSCIVLFSEYEFPLLPRA